MWFSKVLIFFSSVLHVFCPAFVFLVDGFQEPSFLMQPYEALFFEAQVLWFCDIYYED